MATSIAILVSPFAVVAIELRPLSRKSPFSRERERGLRRPCVDDEDNDEYDGGDDDDDDNSNNSNNNTTQQNDHEGKIESEDERRVRRRHSELFRSGAPLFIPHVMLCGRYVMLLLLPVNLISLSLSLSLSLASPIFFPSFPVSLSYHYSLLQRSVVVHVPFIVAFIQ